MATNARIAWDYLRKTFNEYATAGILGNLSLESGLNPQNLQGAYEKKLGYTDVSYTKAVDDGTYTNFIKDSAGYGIAQWTYWSRKQNLYNFAKSKGTSIGDLEMQLAFLMQELTTGYKSSCYAPLLAAKSVREASDIFMLKFEKPANVTTAAQEKRAAEGQKFFDEFTAAASKLEEKTEGVTSSMTHVKISIFVKELEAALNRKDGYIMSAYGQNPKTGYLDLNITTEKKAWQPTGWYYTQYTSSTSYSTTQKKKALYWRDHATRVWDCNGLAEGIYELYTGKNINQRARNNYNEWCDPKGVGIIPEDKRVPGAAVFWGDKASTISHVAYLWKPVVANNPKGDWYLIEARGVAYGVVKTKLSERNPQYWGYMTKYYDYSEVLNQPVDETPAQTTFVLTRTLKKGLKGEDVKQLQQNLMKLGFKLPKYKDDGDFGNETLNAVKAFQEKYGLVVDGLFGKKSFAKMQSLI